MAPSASFCEHPVDELTLTNWLRKRHFESSGFILDELAQKVRTSGLKITVIIPAKQVSDTVRGVLTSTVAPLVSAGIVSSVYAVVTSCPNDKTPTVAAAHGARLIYREDVAPEMGPSQGKGDALWRALQVTDGDIVAFLDGDTGDPSPEHLIGILGPLIMHEDIKMVRGCFDRPFKKEGCETLPHEGGRVTELTARPLLNLHWPALAGFSQPLAGEFAARRTLLEKLIFPVGYGVEIATLIDTFEHHGLEAIAQVALGTRQNAHKSLRDLTVMSYAVLYAVQKRIGLEKDIPDKMFIPWKGDFVSVPTVERPPIASYKKLKLKSERILYHGPPFVRVHGVDNFRDPGGQVIEHLTRVRPGLIYRSGAFSKLTPEGRTRLQALGIGIVFDVRSMVELTNHQRVHGGLASTVDDPSPNLALPVNGNPEISVEDDQGDWKHWEQEYHSWADGETGPRRVHIPTFTDEDFSAEDSASRLRDYADPDPEGFARVYTKILSHLGPGMHAILTHIARHPNTPFVIHCTAGKDRTGVIVMLLLLLAGCSPATVAKEYALSEPGLKEWRQPTIKRLVEGKYEFLRGNWEAAERVTGAREEAMRITVGRFLQDWGTVEEWIRCVAGVEEEVMERARRSLLIEL